MLHMSYITRELPQTCQMLSRSFVDPQVWICTAGFSDLYMDAHMEFKHKLKFINHQREAIAGLSLNTEQSDL